MRKTTCHNFVKFDNGFEMSDEILTNVVLIKNWEIVTEMYLGGDKLRIYGLIIGHPTISGYAFPSTFVSFDPTSKIGKAYSGRYYQLNNFIPNGNAKTEQEAFELILNQIESSNSVESAQSTGSDRKCLK